MKVHNGLLTFQPSPIHGRGGFAGRAITTGTRVIEYVGEIITKAESVERCRLGNTCLFYLDEKRDLDGGVDWNPARQLNHSCAPNCTAELVGGQIWIVARRDIQAGEEITFNYSYDLIDYHEHPCRCGAAECVGFMVAEELFEQVRQRKRPFDERS